MNAPWIIPQTKNPAANTKPTTRLPVSLERFEVINRMAANSKMMI